MKIITFITILLFSTISTAQSAEKPAELPPHLLQWAKENPTIKYSPSFNLPPDDFMLRGQHSGFTSDLYKSLNSVLPIRFIPQDPRIWDEQITDLKSGELDVLAVCAKTPQREKDFLFTKPVVHHIPGFLINKRNPKLANIKNWGRSNSLGAIEDTALRGYLKNIKYRPKLITTQSDENGVIQVASNDLDIFLAYQSSAGYWSKVGSLKTVNFIPFPNTQPEPNNICVNKSSPELVEIINWALDSIGEKALNEIRNRWYSHDMTVAEEAVSQGDADADADAYDRNRQITQYILVMFSIIIIIVITFAKWFYSSSDNNNFFGETKFRRAFIFTIATICIAFIISTLIILNSFKQSAYESYLEQMHIAQDGADRIINDLFHEGKERINLLTTKDFSIFTQILVQLAQFGDSNQVNNELIIQSPVLEKVRDHIAGHIRLSPESGFFIINKQNFNVAALNNESIGKESLLAIKAPNYLTRAWNGETLLVPPVISDVHFHEDRIGKALPPTMFFLTPIPDESGDIIALLAVRLDPSQGFSSAFQSSNIGNTGEVYAVNIEGKIISKSRFEAKLIESGVIKNSLSSILHLEISDFAKQHILPKTIVSDTDYYIRDYLDYRDEKVMGDWRWLDQFDIAIVAEIDIDEVLYDYHGVRNLLTLTLVFALATIIAIAGFMLYVGQRAYILANRSKVELEALVTERTSELENKQTQLKRSEQDTKQPLLPCYLLTIMVIFKMPIMRPFYY